MVPSVANGTSPKKTLYRPEGELFRPTFQNGRAHALDTDSSDEDETERPQLESQRSVASTWEKVDSGRLEKDFGPYEPVQNKVTFAVDDNDDEDFQQMEKSSKAAADMPNLSPFPFQDFSVAPPVVKRKKIAQLNSKAKEKELETLAEKKAAFAPSWAEKVQNITADDKLLEAEANGVVGHGAAGQEQQEEEENFKECDRLSNDKENCAPEEEEEEEEVAKADGDDVDAGGPVWVLPPTEETKKKKSKNKKKKRIKAEQWKKFFRHMFGVDVIYKDYKWVTLFEDSCRTFYFIV